MRTKQKRRLAPIALVALLAPMMAPMVACAQGWETDWELDMELAVLDPPVRRPIIIPYGDGRQRGGPQLSGRAYYKQQPLGAQGDFRNLPPSGTGLPSGGVVGAPGTAGNATGGSSDTGTGSNPGGVASAGGAGSSGGEVPPANDGNNGGNNGNNNGNNNPDKPSGPQLPLPEIEPPDIPMDPIIFEPPGGGLI